VLSVACRRHGRLRCTSRNGSFCEASAARHLSAANIANTLGERWSYATAAVGIRFCDIVRAQYRCCQCSQAELRTRVTSVRLKGFARTS
jgi:hypothetical protein